MTAKNNRHTILGIGSYCYPFAVGGVKSRIPDKPIGPIELVDKAYSHGVKIVQLSDNMNLHALPGAEIDKIALHAAGHKITLETGLRGIQPENLYRHILLSERIGSKLLRCVIDSGAYEPNLPQICAALNDSLPLLHKRGIILGIENHDRFSAMQFAKIIETIGDEHIGIVLDTINSFSKEERPAEVLDALASYTVCLHVKDYIIRRRTDAPGLVVAGAIAGEGRLNIPAVLEVLYRRAPRDFSTILELWMEPEETTAATVAKEEEWVAKSITYLRTLIPE